MYAVLLLASGPNSAIASRRMITKITPQHYYDTLPDGVHSPGDIWTDLPLHGLLRQSTARGIVVTPSCDLMNRKVETITYLPILLASEWLISPSFFPDIVSSMNSAIDAASSVIGAVEPVPRYPTVEDLKRIDNILCKAKRSEQKKGQDAIARLAAGARHLRRALDPTASDYTSSDLMDLFGAKRWQEIRQKLVRNSHRSDIYFLPNDGEDISWSGLPTHAFVLFRYPLTAPIRILDIATEYRIGDWSVAMQGLETLHPMAKAFAATRPVKRCRLKERFLSDLMSKYIGVYSRVGAPDFSDATVVSYAEQVRLKP